MIERLVICGDSARPSPQEHNILWLYHLLKTQLNLITSLNPELLNKSPVLTFREWCEFFDPDCKKRPHQIEKQSRKTLFIGFEMNPRSVSQAKEDGNYTIELITHPVRFMDDLVIGVKTSYPLFDSIKQKWSVNEDQIRLEANLMRAAMTHVAGVECPPGTVLLIGQTPFDRSIIIGGKRHTFEDHADRIKEIAHNSSKVLYKPHPFNNDKDHYMFKNWFGMVKDIHFLDSINIYRLLAEPNIKTVFGLSSSVLHEAKYFDKLSINLIPTWWDGFMPISGKNFLSPNFWHDILSPIHACKKIDHIEVPHYHSMLRKLARSSWGYEIIDKQ